MDSLTPMEQWQVIQNNIKGAMIKLGEKILPMVTWALEKLSPIVQWFFQNIETIIPVVGSFIGVLATLTGEVWLFNAAMAANPITWVILGVAALIALITAAIIKFDEWGAMILFLMGPFGRVISAIKLLYDHWESVKKAFQSDGIIGALKRIGIVLLDTILKPLQQALEMLSHLPGVGNIAGNWAGKIEDLRKGMDLVKDKPKTETEDKKGGLIDKLNSLYEGISGTTGGVFSDGEGGGKSGKKTKNKLKGDMDKISGDAKQIRNITVNFDSIHKGDNIISNSGKGMSLEDWENYYNDMMMRVIRNAETS